MYILSSELQSCLRAAIERAESVLPELKFDEYIAIPAFGANVILRFEYVGKDTLTLDALDALEDKLRKAVGPDFMANLMGDASRQCGLDFSRLSEILVRVDGSASVPVRACETHRTGLDADSQIIREHFGLPERYPFWEIQVDTDGLLVIALHPQGEQPPFTKRESILEGRRVRIRFMPDDGSFRGLMKAAAIASERHVSITRILTEHSA